VNDLSKMKLTHGRNSINGKDDLAVIGSSGMLWKALEDEKTRK
jgi:hypothetical protein